MSAPEKKQLISIALLLRQPRQLDLAAATHLVTQAYRSAPAPSKVLPTKNPRAISVLLGPAHLGLINADNPYFKDLAKASQNTNTYAARQAVLDHKTWVSVDYVRGFPPDMPTDNIYPILGMLVAELLGDDVLALIKLPTGPIVAYDFSFIPLLRNRQVQQVFGGTPPDRTVLTHSADSADLDAATAEAQRRWSEFAAAFARRTPKQNFAVKMNFVENDQCEHMWVAVTSIEAKTIRGWLNSTPNRLKKYKTRDPVTLEMAQVEDWIFTDGAQTHGGFQAAVLQRIRDSR